jgi:hypothetical protein
VTPTQERATQVEFWQTCAAPQLAEAQSSGRQVPAAQLSVAAQARPHWPQFRSSTRTSTQPAAQADRPASASHEGREQRPIVHWPVTQSDAAPHTRPSPHLAAQDPPQSTSDSVAPLTPSVQVLATQAPRTQANPLWQRTPSQATSRQAAFTHAWPLGQVVAPHVCVTHAPW